MSIGAQDYIDQLLVKKYSQEKVDNHDNITSMVNPEKMMDALSDASRMAQNFVVLNRKLQTACSAVNARAARYMKAANFS